MLVKLLRRVLASGPYYVRLNKRRIVGRNIATGAVFESSACVSIDGSKTVVSIGEPIDSAATVTIWPFNHPRILIEDFTAAEEIFCYVVRELTSVRFIKPSPLMVVHPDLELEGGVSQIESRALLEIAEGCGARRVHVHYGRQLTDQEVINVANGA